MKIFSMKLPAIDEWGSPLEKMPNCPNCGEDELGMIYRHAPEALCYLCGAKVQRES